MKKNRCARCGKTERFSRVFERITHKDTEFFLCVECAQILYKIDNAQKEGNYEIENALRDSFYKGIRDDAQKLELLNWLSDRHSNN